MWRTIHDYFFLHRGQFWTKFDESGLDLDLDLHLKHYIRSFSMVIDRILWRKFVWIRYTVSDDHAQTTYWRGFVGLKYLQKDPFGFRCVVCCARDDVKFERAYISKRSGGSKPESGRDGSGKHLQGNTIPIFLLFRCSLGYSTSV